MNNQKIILVTGCSSGFGLLTAARLASSGHCVWATMRNFNGRGTLENELAARHAQAFIRLLDVTKKNTIKEVVEEIQEKHQGIDVLINNAGYGIGGFFEDLSEEDMRQQMEVNFFGVQNVCREVIPLMRRRSKGRIINISSVAGQVASPCLGAYNASKWALEAFSESLYFELSLFGISVCIVEPGSYPTNIFTQNAHYAKNFDNEQSPYFPFSQRLKSLSKQTISKLKRDPEDVARLIEKIINKPHPRLRYVSDFSSWMRIKTQKFLPPPLISNIFRRIVYAEK
ncbi:MAG: SDR family oxidoreductase [Candidatus Omnitrophica bacterium]|nr:SDR family oxidoreductase [Candidatus Omnitrophota bacterium]